MAINKKPAKRKPVPKKKVTPAVKARAKAKITPIKPIEVASQEAIIELDQIKSEAPVETGLSTKTIVIIVVLVLAAIAFIIFR